MHRPLQCHKLRKLALFFLFRCPLYKLCNKIKHKSQQSNIHIPSSLSNDDAFAAQKPQTEDHEDNQIPQDLCWLQTLIKQSPAVAQAYEASAGVGSIPFTCQIGNDINNLQATPDCRRGSHQHQLFFS